MLGFGRPASPGKSHRVPADVGIAASAVLSPSGRSTSGAKLLDVFQPTGPSEPHSPEPSSRAAEEPPCVPSPGTNLSLDLDVDNLAALHLQWERQAASADAKQAEIFHSQWNLAREQICQCSRELLTLCSQVRAMRLDLDAEIAQRQELAAHLDAKFVEFACKSNDMERDSDLHHRLSDVENQVSAHLDALRIDFEADVRERGATEQQLKRECVELRSMLTAEREAEVCNRGATEQQFKRECEELRSMLGAEIEAEVCERRATEQLLKRECDELRSMLSTETARRESLSDERQCAQQQQGDEARQDEEPGSQSLQADSPANRLEKVKQELDKVRQEIAEAHATSKEELLKLQGLQAEQVSMHVAKALADIENLRSDLKCDAEAVIQAAAQAEEKATRQELHELKDSLWQELSFFADRVQELVKKLQQQQDVTGISNGEREALAAALEQVQQEFHAGNQEALQALKDERAQLEALRVDLNAEVHNRSVAEEKLRLQCEELQGELLKRQHGFQECTEARALCSPSQAESADIQIELEAAGSPNLEDTQHVLGQLEELMAQVIDNKQVAQELMSRVDAHGEAAAERLKHETLNQVALLKEDLEAELHRMLQSGASSRTAESPTREQSLKREFEELREMIDAFTSRRMDVLDQKAVELREKFEMEVHQRIAGQENLKRECTELRSRLSMETASFSDLLSKHWQALKRQYEELGTTLSAETSSRTEALSNQEEAMKLQVEQALKRECAELRGLIDAEASRRTEELSNCHQSLKQHFEDMHRLLSVETSDRADEFRKNQQALKRECEELRCMISEETSKRVEELCTHHQVSKRECDELRAQLSAETCSRREELARHRQSLQALQSARIDETFVAATASTTEGDGCGKEQLQATVAVQALQVLHEERGQVDQLKLDIENEISSRGALEGQLKRECEELRNLLNAENACRASALAKQRQELQTLHEERCGEILASLQQVRQEFDAKHTIELQTLRQEFGQNAPRSRSSSNSRKHKVQENVRSGSEKNHERLVDRMEQLQEELRLKYEDRVDEAAATNCNIQSLRHEVEKDRKERAAHVAQMRLMYDELQERVESLIADEVSHGFELQEVKKAMQCEAQMREKGVGDVCLTLDHLQVCLEAAGIDTRHVHSRKSERQELGAQALPTPAAKVKVLPPFLVDRPDPESQSGPEIETTADSQTGSLVRKQQEDRCWDTSSSPASLTPPFSFSSTQGCSGGSAIHRTEDESQGVVVQNLPWDSFNTCHVCSESIDEIKRELTSWLRRAFDDESRVRAQGAEQVDPLYQDSQCKVKERYAACVDSVEGLSAASRLDFSTGLDELSQSISSFSNRFQEELAVEKQERMREVSEIRSRLLGLGIADLTREAQALRWHFDPTLQTSGPSTEDEARHMDSSNDAVIVLRQDLVAERDERIEEISRLTCNFQCLETQISTQLEEIHEQTKTFGAILPAEASEISCGEEHGVISAATFCEVQSELSDLREALEREAQLREDGSALIASSLKQLQQHVDTDLQERAKQVAYLVERLRFAPDMKERDDALRAEMLSYKNKYVEEHASLSQNFEELQSQVVGQLEHLKEHIVTRMADVTAEPRSTIERHLEADLGARQCAAAVEDLQREVMVMRQDLDHYAKMSTQNNEVATTALRHMQEKLEIQRGKRIADVAELSENMQLDVFSDALRLEIRKIQDGTTTRLGEFQGNLEGLESRVAEYLAKMKPFLQDKIANSSGDVLPEWKDQTTGTIRRLQEQLDIEVEERSRIMAGFTEHLQSLPDALSMEVHEHVQEFREDLEAQTASVRRDILTEKEERAIEGAALRCSLQGLEGRTEEKLVELRCSLDAALSTWKAFKDSAMKSSECAVQLNSSSPTAHKQLDLHGFEGGTTIVSS